ncbi:hypothetical protein RCL_jg19207.t1 [Rhizophagus clarus]|uniref:Uncharacterized protein n=1 Tax=Rhizophagus clarus TaxID=94130 RepID=A0A8H3LZ67_9GLOM|nr:hypothetical protein RCL_jg19207.t1 [Rhizophagus clarus]
MKQVQVNAKTSTKPATSRVILPRSILTKQQVQQQTLPPILPQQHTFFQHTHPHFSQQQYDPQLYSLPLTSPQNSQNFNQLEIEQVRI